LQSTFRYTQFIMLKKNTGPGDSTYRLAVTTPGADIRKVDDTDPRITTNILEFGANPAQYAGTSVQWDTPQTQPTTLAEIDADMVIAAGVFSALSPPVESLLRGDRIAIWSRYYAGVQNPFAGTPPKSTGRFATQSPFIGNPGIFGIYSNHFFWNPFIPENYRGVTQSTGTNFSAIESILDPLFFNGTVKNLFLDLLDQSFPAQRFGNRFSNFGSVMFDGKVEFCEVEGMSGLSVILENFGLGRGAEVDGSIGLNNSSTFNLSVNKGISVVIEDGNFIDNFFDIDCSALAAVPSAATVDEILDSINFVVRSTANNTRASCYQDITNGPLSIRVNTGDHNNRIVTLTASTGIPSALGIIFGGGSADTGAADPDTPVVPDGYVSGRGEIESCLTANFTTISNYRNDLPQELTLAPIDVKNTVERSSLLSLKYHLH